MLTTEHIKKLKDKLWRLNHLYYITNKDGKQVKFKMTPEQLDYFKRMHNRNIILKSRQLGFTTEECIIQLDAALFESSKCALIAHTLPDAKRLFREKTKYAYDLLPEELKAANPVINDSAGELVFSKGGSVSIGVSFRGGTLKRLHVSEFGKICARNPEKAREIVTGALEAVSLNGTATLESTAEGNSGYFFDYCTDSEKRQLQDKPLSNLDFKFFFYAWHQNKEYAIESIEPLPKRLIDYFQELELKHGINTTPRQQAWYYAKEKSLGEDMKREYPSIPSEAFSQSIEGAYYSKQLTKLYATKRIGELPDNNHLPVMTIWDIGVGDSTAIWFIRKVGEEYHAIDYYENSGEGLRHYLKVLKDKRYNYSTHYAPHDIENREFGSDAKSRKELARAGYEIEGIKYSLTFEVVPKASISDGIEAVREILPKCAFDEAMCEQGIKCLENYRKEWNDKLGCWRDNPLHDWSSHGADAFRYFAIAVTKKKRSISTQSIPGFGY